MVAAAFADLRAELLLQQLRPAGSGSTPPGCGSVSSSPASSREGSPVGTHSRTQKYLAAASPEDVLSLHGASASQLAGVWQQAPGCGSHTTRCGVCMCAWQQPCVPCSSTAFAHDGWADMVACHARASPWHAAAERLRLLTTRLALMNEKQRLGGMPASNGRHRCDAVSGALDDMGQFIVNAWMAADRAFLEVNRCAQARCWCACVGDTCCQRPRQGMTFVCALTFQAAGTYV